MKNNDKFKGIITPISTIIDEKENLDKEGMAKLIDYLIDSDVNGLFFLGSGGEFSQMSFSQRKEVAEFGINYVNNRVPVLIGTGSNNTKESILLSKHAQNKGADGIIVINPYYWNYSESNLFAYFNEISNSVDLPMFIYNYPDVTGQDLDAELVLKLVENNHNIIGIKDTIDSATHINEMILKVKGEYPHFKVFAGFDHYYLSTLQNGGDGAILGTSNFAPEFSVRIYNSFKNQNYYESIVFQRKLNILPNLYQLDVPFISVIKEATYERGVKISTKIIEPVQPLKREYITKMKTILNDVGL